MENYCYLKKIELVEPTFRFVMKFGHSIVHVAQFQSCLTIYLP